MSTPCACGSVRDMLVGVAGGQVWQGGCDEANIPTLAAMWLPLALGRGGIEARRAPSLSPVPRRHHVKVSVEWQRQAQEVGLLPNWLGSLES